MLRSPVVSMRLTLLLVVSGLSALSVRGAHGQAQIPVNFIPIYAIQGSGPATPLPETWLDAYGMVTGVTNTGFYLQDPLGDDDPATSDGIFVYTRSRPDVRAGQCAAVTRAFASEFYEKTELSRGKRPQAVDYCGTTAVDAAPIAHAQPGIDPARRFEHVEGMVVRVDDLVGTVQGATKRFRNGDVEIAFLPDPWTVELPAGRVFQRDAPAMQGLMYVSGSLGAELPDLNWGDRIGLGAQPGDADAVLAILDYNFGKYQLMPLPGQTITATVTTPQSAGPFIPPPQEDELTVCSVNLWGLGRGSAQFPDAATYALQLQKRAHAMATALNGCTVIALQETGTPQDAENLAAALRNRYGLDYAAIALRGPGTINPEFPLTNALLALRDRVEVLDAMLGQGCSPVDYEVAPILETCIDGEHPLFNRPPLVVSLRVSGAWRTPYEITVVNNHWKSKGGDESVNVVRRTAQAAHVAALVQQIVDANPQARVLVTGDLNDYYASGPVETLRETVTPELVHLYSLLPPLDRYTYVFNGGSQVLDHMLATPNLAADLAALEPVRINADYAYPANVDVTAVQHASDHDPVALTLRPDRAAWAGGNLRVPGVTVLLRDAEGVIVGETVTDDLGDFRFWRLSPGEYEAAYSAPPLVAIEPPTHTLSLTAGGGVIITPTVRHVASEITAGLVMSDEW